MSLLSKDMLAVRNRKKLRHHGFLLAGLVADKQSNPADAIDFRLLDGPHLPDTGLVVAPTGLQKALTVS